MKCLHGLENTENSLSRVRGTETDASFRFLCVSQEKHASVSSRVGALAMDRLRSLDHIAYIRFASVYQSFQDLEDLKREVDSLFAEGPIVKKGKPTR